MRNILEYPITIEEKITALKRAIAMFIADGSIGGIDAPALSELVEELQQKQADRAGGVNFEA